MYCSNCGYQAKDADKFCANCGQPLEKPERAQFVDTIEEDPQPVKRQKKKKSCLSRFFSTLTTFFLLLFLFAIVFGGSDDSESPKSTATTKPTATAAASLTATPTTKPTATPKSTSTPEPTNEPVTAEDVEVIKNYLSVLLSESYSYHDISGDETGFTINVSGDGLAEAVALYKALGKGADSEDWVTLKDSFVYLYKMVYQALETFGMKDPALMMSVVNDQNHDYYLLIVADGGTVIYDVLAE